MQFDKSCEAKDDMRKAYENAMTFRKKICNDIPHTIDEIIAWVEKLNEVDTIRQQVLIGLAMQFDKACEAKDDLRKAYEKCMTFRKIMLK